MPQALQGWTIDHKVPIALIVTILLQTVAFAYWVGGIANTVAAHDREIAGIKTAEAARVLDDRALYARLATFDANMSAIRASLARIETKLEREASR